MSALTLTLGWVARAVGGRLASGDPDAVIGPVTTDSRTLQPGDFFVALRGERFDAHAFVDDVLARGASGAIVGRSFTARPAAPRKGVPYGLKGVPYGLIEVDDTLKALQDLAHAVRREAGTKVIAITGSAGKTTTKEAIAELLS
ncbi:MAG: Mur ligase domain-containing protein, partial [Vicinamibacterales bacterium]